MVFKWTPCGTAAFVVLLASLTVVSRGMAATTVTAHPVFPQDTTNNLNVVDDGASTRLTIQGAREGDSTLYAISSSTGLTSFAPCAQVDANSASCPYFGPLVGVGLQAGDDMLRLRGVSRSEVSGGDGADTLVGGAGRDELAGGWRSDNIRSLGGDDVIGAVSFEDGSDQLAGGAGNDLVTGGRGRDLMRSGAGDDRIIAADNQRDREIDCGPGEDHVFIDEGLDPKPKGCEHVHAGKPPQRRR